LTDLWWARKLFGMGTAKERLIALLKSVCLPLAGSALAGEISNFFEAAAKTGLVAAIGVSFASTSGAIIFAYAAIFGLSAWVASEDDKKKTLELSSLFRSLSQKLTGVEMILSSAINAGEIAATLSLFEQTEIAELAAEAVEKRFCASDRIKSEIINLLRAVGASTEDEVRNLYPFLTDTNDRVRDILAMLRSKDAPLLRLPLQSTSANPFAFSARRLTLRGREKELEKLEQFVQGTPTNRFSWWLWMGPGGIGKSRLGLELCLSLRSEWDAGFLARNVSYDRWQAWQPSRPTLVVVDYLAARARGVSDAILTLTDRAPTLAHPVRFLLLERLVDQEALWMQQLMRTDSGSEGDRVRSSEHAPHEQLGRLSFESVWEIISEIFARRNLQILEAMRDPLLLGLEITDPMRRPLFAALAGEALADDRNYRQWSAEHLASHVVRRERSRWEQQLAPRELCNKFINLLTIATVCSALPVTEDIFEKHLAKLASERLIPMMCELDYITYCEMTGAIICEGEELPPWEPDIIGECFVLDRIAKAGPPEKIVIAKLLRAAWDVKPEYVAVFVLRAASDFPTHSGLKRLLDRTSVPDEAIGVWVGALADVATSLAYSGEDVLRDYVVDLIRTTLPNERFTTQATESLCRALYNLGVVAMERSDSRTAIGLFDEVIETLNADIMIRGAALTNRAILRNRDGDLGGAIADATAAIVIPGISDEIKASSLNNRGDFRRATGLLDKAWDDHSAVLQLAPASDERRFVAHFRMGLIRLAKKEFAEALREFSAIDALSVRELQRTEALVAQGHSLEHLEQDEEAMQKYALALKRQRISESDKSRVHLGRARILIKKGDNEAALEAISRAIIEGAAEFRVEALMLRTGILAKTDKLAIALAELRDAIADPSNSEDMNMLRLHRGTLVLDQDVAREYEEDLRRLFNDHSAASHDRARAGEILAAQIGLVEERPGAKELALAAIALYVEAGDAERAELVRQYIALIDSPEG
jgi:tetratricopeptide (TPR) repeat protein